MAKNNEWFLVWNQNEWSVAKKEGNNYYLGFDSNMFNTAWSISVSAFEPSHVIPIVIPPDIPTKPKQGWYKSKFESGVIYHIYQDGSEERYVWSPVSNMRSYSQYGEKIG